MLILFAIQTFQGKIYIKKYNFLMKVAYTKPINFFMYYVSNFVPKLDFLVNFEKIDQLCV